MIAKYLGYRLAQKLANRLPRLLSYSLAEGVADVRWRTSAADRQAVQHNLSLVLGVSVPERSPFTREVFRNFGRYLVEFFTAHQALAPTVAVDGVEHLADARRRQRGAIILTAHLGNWELGAVAIQRLGFPMAVVALPHDDPRMDRLFNAQRQRCGIDVIPLGGDAARHSLRYLRAGRFLGLLGDRVFTQHGVTVTLAGQPVTLPRGPAVLSLRSQAPLIPAFFLREGKRAFHLYVEPPIWPPVQAVHNSSVQTMTQNYARCLERALKQFATQWLLFRSITPEVQSPLLSQARREQRPEWAATVGPQQVVWMIPPPGCHGGAITPFPRPGAAGRRTRTER